MKNKKIILAGGSGFIGQEMIRYFGNDNRIVVLTRQSGKAVNNRHRYSLLKPADVKNVSYVKWDAKSTGDWVKELDGADLLINLAGKTVNCRYTEKNKKEIFDSRTHAVTALGAALQQCAHPPLLWINASSATIYRHATDRPQDEYLGQFHHDFSVQVCQLWEKTFFEQKTASTRKVALRMAITLGPGGVLIPYFNLMKFGMGGRQGSGQQMYSWVHIEDTCRMIEWLADHPAMEGVYNCCSPAPVTNGIFMRTLRRVTGHAIGIPVPAWMLRIGAGLIGTETELVLKSRWVVPTRMLETGFHFRYPQLEAALDDIISKTPRRQYMLF